MESRIFRGEGFAPKGQGSALRIAALTTVRHSATDESMNMLEELIPHARQFAETLAPGRHRASALPAIWSAMHGRMAPRNIAGAAWRAAGLIPYKSGSHRYWVRPEALPPLTPLAPTKPLPAGKAKRRYTVDLTPLHMQPGDGVWVTVTSDAITIRKATA